MASGFGLNGGPGRCYTFWQEVLGCYVVNSPEGETGKKKCTPALDDYYECLHHRKEALRTMKMQAAYRKAEAASPRENAPSAEQIRSLGLLGKEEEASAVLSQL
ncbi:NADH-ubiquinone oxidoreductase kd subunit [Penicillium herquei]|nr:NADH-ubiquinone oxidoreductase kd subunit [Penicillium herquei]